MILLRPLEMFVIMVRPRVKGVFTDWILVLVRTSSSGLLVVATAFAERAILSPSCIPQYPPHLIFPNGSGDSLTSSPNNSRSKITLFQKKMDIEALQRQLKAAIQNHQVRAFSCSSCAAKALILYASICLPVLPCLIWNIKKNLVFNLQVLVGRMKSEPQVILAYSEFSRHFRPHSLPL